jgi:hypothetical protein
MRHAVLCAMILVGNMLCAQDKKPWNIDRLCGRLEHVEKIPDRKHADIFSEKPKALRDVRLVMYERQENEACCEKLTPIDEIMTGKNGLFNFKDAKPGLYWLAANWDGKEYKSAVVYKPQKSPGTICSQQGLQFDYAGNADWWITVTVD